MGSMVAYRCAAPSHQVSDGGPDKLTVHEGEWAFCPYDARRDGHEWVTTGGLPLSALTHAAAPRRSEATEGSRA